jgi:hypothetical protein
MDMLGHYRKKARNSKANISIDYPRRFCKERNDLVVGRVVRTVEKVQKNGLSKNYKNMNLLIRNESDKDYRRVEEITREAFWDLYVPGCDEHYLVHILRNHPDFIPELDFVAIVDDQIVGNIMYAKSQLINEEGTKLDSITFWTG